MTNEEREKRAIKLLTEAAELLSWNVAFDGNAENVDYVILGLPEKVDRIVELIEKDEK